MVRSDAKASLTERLRNWTKQGPINQNDWVYQDMAEAADAIESLSRLVEIAVMNENRERDRAERAEADLAEKQTGG